MGVGLSTDPFGETVLASVIDSILARGATIAVTFPERAPSLRHAVLRRLLGQLESQTKNKIKSSAASVISLVQVLIHWWHRTAPWPRAWRLDLWSTLVQLTDPNSDSQQLLFKSEGFLLALLKSMLPDAPAPVQGEESCATTLFQMSIAGFFPSPVLQLELKPLLETSTILGPFDNCISSLAGPVATPTPTENNFSAFGTSLPESKVSAAPTRNASRFKASSFRSAQSQSNASAFPVPSEASSLFKPSAFGSAFGSAKK